MVPPWASQHEQLWQAARQMALKLWQAAQVSEPFVNCQPETMFLLPWQPVHAADTLFLQCHSLRVHPPASTRPTMLHRQAQGLSAASSEPADATRLSSVTASRIGCHSAEPASAAGLALRACTGRQFGDMTRLGLDKILMPCQMMMPQTGNLNKHKVCCCRASLDQHL